MNFIYFTGPDVIIERKQITHLSKKERDITIHLANGNFITLTDIIPEVRKFLIQVFEAVDMPDNITQEDLSADWFAFFARAISSLTEQEELTFDADLVYFANNEVFIIIEGTYHPNDDESNLGTNNASIRNIQELNKVIEERLKKIMED